MRASFPMWMSWLLIFGLWGCEPMPSWKSVKEMVHRDFPEVKRVSAGELRRELDASPEDEAPVLLDVREEAEYRVSHLAGAVRVQPGTDAAEIVRNLDPETPIVAYCSVGYRSSELARKLSEQGFTNVRNLEGSIFEWANAGFPVVRDGEEVREVHPFDEKWGTLLNEELRAYEPRSE